MDARKIGLAAADVIDLLEQRATEVHEVDPDSVDIIETAFVVRYAAGEDEYIVYRAGTASPLHTAQLLNDAAKLALDVSR